MSLPRGDAPEEERLRTVNLTRAEEAPATEQEPSPAPGARLALNALWGDIGAVHEAIPDVQAIVVGHYAGVRPQASELALDRSISRALPPLGGKASAPERDLLLTHYTSRGTMRGALGEPFMLPDPRNAQRIIVAMGLGEPGRSGSRRAQRGRAGDVLGCRPARHHARGDGGDRRRGGQSGRSPGSGLVGRRHAVRDDGDAG